MKIAIGSDHRGFKLKNNLVNFLKKRGYYVKDFGTFSTDSCDYPIIGYEVAKSVSRKKFQRGILICHTGIGMSMVANKVKGVRAALCHTGPSARFSREHNDSNVLVLAGGSTVLTKAERILKIWFSTRALSGRHKRRVRQISKIERLEI